MKPCHCRPISKACVGLELNHNSKIIVVQLLDSKSTLEIYGLFVYCLWIIGFEWRILNSLEFGC